MPRLIDPAMQAGLESGVIVPALLVMLTFKSGTRYIWSGIGPLVVDGQTYTGVGSLGSIGNILEATEVRADGTTVSLSGIDPTLYAECQTDIQLGAPAKIWFALLTEGVVMGTPYLLFSGQVDKPAFVTGVDQLAITLSLESRLVDLQRATQRRYTAEDQNAYYPNDTAFVWVPTLQDISLVWG